jgi:cyclohexyl-isocyanide hydratase
MVAAGLFNDCKITTHWAFLDSLKLFSNKYNIQVIEKKDHKDYPRSVLDEEHKRFSGGGVSSSIDLAVELINQMTGEDSAKWTTLTNQYAPDPIFQCGDPALAEKSHSSALTDAVLREWAKALQDTNDAVNHFLQSPESFLQLAIQPRN